jgi:hypothetical protein
MHTDPLLQQVTAAIATGDEPVSLQEQLYRNLLGASAIDEAVQHAVCLGMYSKAVLDAVDQASMAERAEARAEARVAALQAALAGFDARLAGSTPETRSIEFDAMAEVAQLLRHAIEPANQELLQMPNMSYCKFQNTALAFDDCADTLDRMMDGDGDPLSREEMEAAKRLLRRAQKTIASLAEYLGSEADVLVDDDLDRVFVDLQADLS